MPKPSIPVPYRIRCRDCKHPGKYHGLKGCVMKECNCNHFEAEEMEHELCMNAIDGKQICVQCSSDNGLVKGLCGKCRNAKST